MKTDLIRKKFLTFFEQNGHTVVDSSAVIPAEDPTILFANAGMNQFKDCFLGKEKRTYIRAATSQKCVRAGGKHNDLENVGFTSRHLTFFEMLGNFSFGDYFKKEAIEYAWKFLTEELALPAERLYVTVYEKDDESYRLWHTIAGVPYEQISKLGEADNFWSMGDVGPCGPCTEIYYDYGADSTPGGENQKPGDEGERFVEIWNLVFMQYNRDTDGKMNPLVQTGVDTGIGLERLAAVLQNKKTVFHIDSFQPIREAIEKETSIKYETATVDQQTAFHVLCDHIRSTSFIITDGGAPSNEGRGYVLRKIIRRAALFAQKLSLKPFFHKLVTPLIKTISQSYPSLKQNQTLIESVLLSEVEKFSSNLLVGKNIFERYVEELNKIKVKIISGKQAFKLYDTYGFPLELTKVLAHENQLTVDAEGFAHQMSIQQATSGKKTAKQTDLDIPTEIKTEFVGYETLTTQSTILWNHKHDDKSYWIVLDSSPFYVESGGQVNDQGTITVENIELPVIDLKKVITAPNQVAIAILCQLPEKFSIEKLSVGTVVTCLVNATVRANTVRNHTATHMLQAALIEVLGPQIKQAGSIVEPDYLRFDFSFHRPMTTQEIKKTEDIINEKIQENISTEVTNTNLKDAQAMGAKAFFGEKYNPENVRVVHIPGFSTELCGGTHASATGIIGLCKIISEASLATGVRRIVAITGPAAIALFQQLHSNSKVLSEQFKVQTNEILPAVQKQTEQLMNLIGEIKQLKKKLIQSNIAEWVDQMKSINNIPVSILTIDDVTPDDVKQITQKMDAQKQGIILITSAKESRLIYFIFMSPSIKASFTLKELHKHLVQTVGVKGGGKDRIVQGSGKTTHEKLSQALTTWIKEQ